MIDGAHYAIDSYTFDPVVDPISRLMLFTPTPTTMTAVVVIPGSTEASSHTDYRFEMKPSFKIPHYSKMVFTFPKTITLKNELLKVSCRATINGI